MIRRFVLLRISRQYSVHVIFISAFVRLKMDLKLVRSRTLSFVRPCGNFVNSLRLQKAGFTSFQSDSPSVLHQ